MTSFPVSNDTYKKQNAYVGLQLGGVMIASLIIYAIRRWPCMRVPAQTVDNCGNIENSSWHGQSFTKGVRTIGAGYMHIRQQ